jgi:hypothetical protein
MGKATVRRVRQRIFLPVLLLCAVLTISSAGQVTRVTVAETQAAVIITVSGLPEGRSANFREVLRNLDGSFSHRRHLGRLNTGQLTVQIHAGSFVDAEPVMISDNERYAVPERFSPHRPGGRLIENYRHEFAITSIVWTHGANQPGASSAGALDGGTISPEPGWFPAGSRVRLVAQPRDGFKFLHWGVFEVSERVDLTKVTAAGARLDVNMDRPMRVAAAFGR